MTTRTKLIFGGIAALIVCVGLGYAWGASGRFEAQNALEDARLELDLSQARVRVLEARVSLYNVNFGEASRQFEDSKAPLRRARQRFADIRRNEAAGSLSAALEHIEEAQRLAGRLDQAANSRADEALRAIDVAAAAR